MQTNSFLAKMLNFDTMITPSVIKFIYYFFSGLGIIIGLVTMNESVLAGLLIAVIAPFMTRITCEGIIVIFKLHENLSKIANKETNSF